MAFRLKIQRPSKIVASTIAPYIARRLFRDRASTGSRSSFAKPHYERLVLASLGRPSAAVDALVCPSDIAKLWEGDNVL